MITGNSQCPPEVLERSGEAEMAVLRGRSIRDAQIVWVIVLAGLALRLILFGGDGLGDDINYFCSFRRLYDGTIDVNDLYHLRFSYWIPQLLIWKLLGINEFTFILPVLLSSLGCIYVTYLIGKAHFSPGVGLIAACLMAFNPFEVLNATLISTDVNLSLYMLLSVYFFIIAQQRASHLYFFLSALFVFFSFVNKPQGIYAFIPIVIFFFAHEKTDLNDIKGIVELYWVFLVTAFLLFGGLCVVSWIITGDPFFYVLGYKTHVVTWLKIDAYQLSIYPKQMFYPFDFKERLHGYHFYALLLSLLFIRKGNWKPVLPIFLWFITFLCCLVFVPHGYHDGHFVTSQRIFRYFVIVMPPSILFIAYLINELKNRYALIFGVAFSAYMCLSLISCFDATWIVRNAFGEVRQALKYVKAIGDVHVYSDYYFMSKLKRLKFKGEINKKHHFLHCTSQKEWDDAFSRIHEGYVVTGGGRLPYYAVTSWVSNLGTFDPPDYWQLVKEFDPTLHPPWKQEPLRIWHIAYWDFYHSKESIIQDPAFNSCLRTRVFPLRPEDGLPLTAPITERLAEQVESIWCERMEISDVKGLETFRNLKSLNLGGNAIRQIDVGTLKQLEGLFLGANKIDCVNGLKNTRQLRALWVGGNKLTTLDVSGLKALEDLRVDQNRLTDLNGTQDLIKLRAVYLGGNPRLECQSLLFPNPETLVFVW